MKSSDLKYNLLLEEPVYKILTIFSFVVVALSLFVSVMHAGLYGTYEFHLDIIGLPLCILLCIYGFTDSLILQENGALLYKRVDLYFFKRTEMVDAVDVTVDQHFSVICLKRNEITKRSRMIFPKEVAQTIASNLSVQLQPHQERA